MENDEGYSSFYNKQCGGFSLVQHRVKEMSSVKYMPGYEKVYPKVWPNLESNRLMGFLGEDVESLEPFGPSYDPEKYQWSKDSAGEFDGGGYMVHFPVDPKKMRYMMAELKRDRFIDKSTRSLMFIVNVLNAGLELFAVIEFSITLDAAGKVTTSKILHSLRPVLYGTPLMPCVLSQKFAHPRSLLQQSIATTTFGWSLNAYSS